MENTVKRHRMKEGRLIRRLLPESRYDSVDLIGINEGNELV